MARDENASEGDFIGFEGMTGHACRPLFKYSPLSPFRPRSPSSLLLSLLVERRLWGLARAAYFYGIRNDVIAGSASRIYDSVDNRCR